MPWLGDGTWVQDAGLARAIIHGRTNYRPHSGVLPTEVKPRHPQTEKDKEPKVKREEKK